MADAPERIWAEETGTATKGGQRFRIGRWITDETASHPHEYIRADVARADAELAVAEAIRRAAEEAASEGWPGETCFGVSEREEGAMDCADRIETAILALAPADALAEVQRLRAERDAALAQMKKLRGAGLDLKSIVEGIQGAMEHGTWRAERSNLRMKDTEEWVTFYNVMTALDEDARDAKS